MIQFLTTPPLGTIVKLDDQAYRLLRIEPYVRLDGVRTKALTWEAHCPVCGEPFEVVSGLKSKGFTRRCAEHRNPMARVKPASGRGQPLQITVIEPDQAVNSQEGSQP